MYKQAIQEKIAYTNYSRGPNKGAQCKDCHQRGHINKNYYKCSKHIPETAQQVGTSLKRKQTFEMRSDKRAAKYPKRDFSSMICSVCGRQGHSSSRSVQCEEHKQSKLDIYTENLGSSYEPFVIKVPFGTSNPLQTEELKKKVTHACESVRQLIFRAQLFVNFYILSRQKDTLHCVFTNGFWYSITQLVNACKVTNPDALPLDLMKSWKAFCEMYPSVVHPDYLYPGEVQSIAYACTEVATAYQNAIVELFQKRLMQYFRHVLRNMFSDMKKDNIDRLVEYCYQNVCGGTPKWPSNLLEASQKQIVDARMSPLAALIQRPVTLETLSANPEVYIRPLAFILNEYEAEHGKHLQKNVPSQSLPRLFSLFPCPSCQWRFVTIDAVNLRSFTGRNPQSHYIYDLRLFLDFFDIKTLVSHDIIPNGNNQVLFGNQCKSDSFSMNFLFYRRRRSAKEEVENGIPDHDLTLEDFDSEEIDGDYRPIFVDPGRRSVFVAAVGNDLNEHQVRQCSTKEYYHMTRSTKYSQDTDALKKKFGIKGVETDMPTAKTTKLLQYHKYCRYLLNFCSSLFKFYGAHTAEYHFYLYQGRQQAKENMVNMLVHGTKKYDRKRRSKDKKKNKKKNKMQIDKNSSNPQGNDVSKKQKWKKAKFSEDKSKIPLIVFGAGMDNKQSVPIKRQRVGVTGILERQLRQREKNGDLLVVPIDEYNTSKVCSKCKQKSLNHMPHTKWHAVLYCSQCKTVWNRDENASNNMMHIANTIWSGGTRPAIYKP